ncbi:galactosyltransferase-related protein [uncultured Polaribacter sp.]|uniref:glycosyltransferase family 2 protein n=1 Tax=uncultured Polaribacter sp. TaxID=174711 RepID=UPI0026228F1D|nr:galactosyltransferase-related protein [uncultured Polaribacter sp.]
MVTLIFPYRNRDLKRINRSLDSLKNQKTQNFKVFFVDYGTKLPLSEEVKKLVTSYDFVTYFYSFEMNKPWNKSKAINIALKKITTPFTFIADIDVIFNLNFTSKLKDFYLNNVVTYFKVAYLSEEESKIIKKFEDYKISHYSNLGDTGLSLFPTEVLKEVNGFDEFYHFWGSEDTDAHVRMQNKGLEVKFFNDSILLLHQWHKIYRQKKDKLLTTDLRCKNIVELNHKHLVYNKCHNITKVNKKLFGEIVTKKEVLLLEKIDLIFNIFNDISYLDYFKSLIFTIEDRIVLFKFKKNTYTIKDKIKYLLGKKEKSKDFPMKEINDEILKLLIINFRNHLYSFIVLEDLNEIHLKIKL